MTIPDAYPYVDRNERARCFLWRHDKYAVRVIRRRGMYVERYDCRCGKFYWLSAKDGYRPITAYKR